MSRGGVHPIIKITGATVFNRSLVSDGYSEPYLLVRKHDSALGIVFAKSDIVV